MAVSIRSLGIDRLAIDDRLALVEELWDSIVADTTTIPLADSQKAELDRRIAEHDGNPEDVVSWEEIRASIAGRLKA